MRRYMLQVAYCGSRLRGIQKQSEEVEAARGSVQGLLEKGLATLYRYNPESPEQLYFSSRTDKGVHAVCNTAHVDLPSNNNGVYHEPITVTYKLNRFFTIGNIDIRIHKTTLVPSTFHARYDAVARKYLYRLAVTPPSCSGLPTHLDQFVPTVEIGRVYLVRPPFDVERLEPVCRLLEGTHDFASFGNAPPKNQRVPRPTVRNIHSIHVTPGRPFLDPSYDPLYSQLQFWDVTIHASGFLYKQVRRTVGVLVGVAQGRASLQEVQHMLDVPSHSNWISRCHLAPPQGLYLLKVEYPPHTFCEKEGEVVCGGKGETEEEEAEEVLCEDKVEAESKEAVCGDKVGVESDLKGEVDSESKEVVCGGKARVESDLKGEVDSESKEVVCNSKVEVESECKVEVEGESKGEERSKDQRGGERGVNVSKHQLISVRDEILTQME